MLDSRDESLMGFVQQSPKATYHAFWDESKGYAKPSDGRPVYEALQPSFHWPAGA